jgi:enamine deaminase RidA (YjgF/YER057c/UK114 family)
MTEKRDRTGPGWWQDASHRRRHLLAGLSAAVAFGMGSARAARATGDDASVDSEEITMQSENESGRVEHLNPEGLVRNPAFSNVVVVSGPARTIYIGGQDAVDATGQIIGGDDIGAQAGQVFVNVQTALEAAGAGLEHVVKWTILVVEGQPLEPGFAAFQQVWGDRPNPPAITMAYVSGLARPEFLVEIEAVAVVPL